MNGIDLDTNILCQNEKTLSNLKGLLRYEYDAELIKTNNCK